MPRGATLTDSDFARVQAWALAHVVELAHDYGGVTLRHGRCACPLHGGDNPQAFSVANGKGWHCFTGDCGGGDGVGLVVALTKRDYVTVVRELAPRAGVFLEDGEARRSLRARAHARVQRTETPPAPPAPPDPLAALRGDGMVPSLAPTIHRAVWETLTLTARGADYLHGRALDPDAADAYGFRAIDGRRAWDDVGALLGESFTPEELEGAGWWGCYGSEADDAPPHVWLPWRGHVPALLLPYWHRGDLVGLRFRRMDSNATPKTLSLKGAGARLEVPFNADALDDCDGAELHIAEGELDAFTLHLYGARVVGLPGATSGTAKGGAWLARLADVGRVVTWYDNDPAGQKGRDAFAHALADRYGRAWLAERGRAVTLYDDDVNGCHQRGALADFFTRAEWRP